MPREDYRGLALSGASPRALELYEAALEEYLSFRGAPGTLVARALEDSPGFAMGHAFAAYLALGGRDPAGVSAAREILARSAALPMNARERAHMRAIEALAAGEIERAGAVHSEILAEHPRDVLALGAAHSGDYVRGDVRTLHRRVARSLGAWTPDLPGYHSVLAMYAFGLEEAGHYARAEDYARRALEIEPRDVRAHHAMVHVYEMLGRPEDGIRWAGERAEYWTGDSPAAVHNWWHVALFNLALGRRAQALAIYDWRIRPHMDRSLSMLIDATALLWRFELLGADTGRRWGELASRWEPHAADGYCAFSDLHAMMAFAADGRRESAEVLLGAQQRRAGEGGTNGEMTRLVGLPASRALRAFGEGRYAEAAERLGGLPQLAHRLGGSRAQHGIVALTGEEAVRRAGRPAPEQRLTGT
jgi:tetratricopeptide (TPR) repeat protein